MTESDAKHDDQHWKQTLSPEQYRITRQAGTEAPFTGPYWNEKAPGIYHCVCCRQPLFDAETKYDSGTGWPSFYDVIDQGAIELRRDASHGMVRTEALCAKCGAHLGHVFEDGPDPTGKRYCMNSASLHLEKRVR